MHSGLQVPLGPRGSCSRLQKPNHFLEASVSLGTIYNAALFLGNVILKNHFFKFLPEYIAFLFGCPWGEEGMLFPPEGPWAPLPPGGYSGQCPQSPVPCKVPGLL